MRANSIPEIEQDDVDSGRLKKSIFRFMWSSLAVLAVFSALLFLRLDRDAAREIFLSTTPLIVAFSVFSSLRPGLFRRPGGDQVYLFEAANILTAIRIFLVLPTLILLINDFILWGIFVYVVILLTDVADGFVARRYNQETSFGLMLDPFGDIASTMAVFWWLWMVGIVPLWLFIILAGRYAEFFMGITVLTLAGKTPRLKATLPGKIAGVIQGVGIVILMSEKLGVTWLPADTMNRPVFIILGLAFGSVIVSQTCIGIDAIRK